MQLLRADELLAVKPDIAFDPVDVRLLASQAVMRDTDRVPDAIEQAQRCGVRRFARPLLRRS